MTVEQWEILAWQRSDKVMYDISEKGEKQFKRV